MLVAYNKIFVKLPTDEQETAAHPHNFLQYIKLLGTIRLPIYWFSDYSFYVGVHSNSAARVEILFIWHGPPVATQEPSSEDHSYSYSYPSTKTNVATTSPPRN